MSEAVVTLQLEVASRAAADPRCAPCNRSIRFVLKRHSKQLSMAPRMEPGDHYVLRKLANELLPWMIGSRQVTRQWFVYGATAYRYGGELATALTGVGIGAPFGRGISRNCRKRDGWACRLAPSVARGLVLGWDSRPCRLAGAAPRGWPRGCGRPRAVRQGLRTNDGKVAYRPGHRIGADKSVTGSGADPGSR